MPHDLGRLTCLIRPRPLRTGPVKGSQKNRQGPGPTRENDQLDRLGLGFTTWCVSTSRIHLSVNQEGNPAPSVFSQALWPLTSSRLSGLLGSDHAGSCLALCALTSLDLVWPSGLRPGWVCCGSFTVFWTSGRSAQSLDDSWYLDKLLDLLGDRKMSPAMCPCVLATVLWIFSVWACLCPISGKSSTI